MVIMDANDTVTVALAVLAGAITLVNPLVTRGNLISGFRQSWINDQRSDLAILCAKATILSSSGSANWALDIEAFEAAASRIRLRQNPGNASEWKLVIAHIDDLHRELWVNKGRWHDVSVRLKAIQEGALRPLKANWNKTRRGETSHLVSLIIAAAFIAAAAVTLVRPTWISDLIGQSHDEPTIPVPKQR